MSYSNQQIAKQVAELLRRNQQQYFQKGTTTSTGVNREINVSLANGKVVRALGWNVSSPGQVNVFWDATNKQYIAWKEETSSLKRKSILVNRKTRPVDDKKYLWDYNFKVLQSSSIEGFDADIDLDLTGYEPVGIANTGSGYLAVLENWNVGEYIVFDTNGLQPLIVDEGDYMYWLGGVTFHVYFDEDSTDQNRVVSCTTEELSELFIINFDGTNRLTLTSGQVLTNSYQSYARAIWSYGYIPVVENYDFIRRPTFSYENWHLNLGTIPTDFHLAGSDEVLFGIPSRQGDVVDIATGADARSGLVLQPTSYYIEDNQQIGGNWDNLKWELTLSGLHYDTSTIAGGTSRPLPSTKYEEHAVKKITIDRKTEETVEDYVLVTPNTTIAVDRYSLSREYSVLNSNYDNVYDSGGVEFYRYINTTTTEMELFIPVSYWRYPRYDVYYVWTAIPRYLNPQTSANADYDYSGEKVIVETWTLKLDNNITYNQRDNYSSTFSGSGTRAVTATFPFFSAGDGLYANTINNNFWQDKTITTTTTSTRAQTWEEYRCEIKVHHINFTFLSVKDYTTNHNAIITENSLIQSDPTYTGDSYPPTVYNNTIDAQITCVYSSGKIYSQYGSKYLYALMHIGNNIVTIQDGDTTACMFRINPSTDITGSSITISSNLFYAIRFGLNSYGVNTFYKKNIFNEEKTGYVFYNEAVMTVTNQSNFKHNPENYIGENVVMFAQKNGEKLMREGIITNVTLDTIPNTQKHNLLNIVVSFTKDYEESARSEFFCFDTTSSNYVVFCSPTDYLAMLDDYGFDNSNNNYYTVTDDNGNETVELAISEIPTTTTPNILRADIYRFNTTTLKWERRPNAITPVSPLTDTSSFVSYHPTASNSRKKRTRPPRS